MVALRQSAAMPRNGCWVIDRRCDVERVRPVTALGSIVVENVPGHRYTLPPGTLSITGKGHSSIYYRGAQPVKI